MSTERKERDFLRRFRIGGRKVKPNTDIFDVPLGELPPDHDSFEGVRLIDGTAVPEAELPQVLEQIQEESHPVYSFFKAALDADHWIHIHSTDKGKIMRVIKRSAIIGAETAAIIGVGILVYKVGGYIEHRIVDRKKQDSYKLYLEQKNGKNTNNSH